MPSVDAAERDRLFEQVIRIRNTFTKTCDRMPLSFDRAERRSYARVPLKVPVTLIPVVTESGQAPADEQAIPAETIDLSLRGMAFTHNLPLPSGRFVIQVNLSKVDRLFLEAQQQWTVPEVGGGYRSGVRFVRQPGPNDGAEASP